jgi:lipoic acid synthetase
MGNDGVKLEIIDLGLLDYEECLEIQKKMVQDRINDKISDSLLMVSHPPVVTIGKSGSFDELTIPSNELPEQGIQLCRTDRGGKSTFHGPGQLIAYPIIKLKEKDVHRYVQTLLNVISGVLIDVNLRPELKPGAPGVWVNNRKIGSIGISLKKWVAYHGIALNVNTDVSCFKVINPCGVVGEEITSIKDELGMEQDVHSISERFIDQFKRAFGYSMPERKKSRYPDWLKIPVKHFDESEKVDQIIQTLNLETVCQSAKCPNIGECYSNGTATFLILGRYCTRNCLFCAVEHNLPKVCDPSEPLRVAKAVKQMALDYAVVTSVTRDDLEDGGADQFVKTIDCIRKTVPDTKIEVLVPDFKGSQQSINRVCLAAPDVFNHNLETVSRLSSLVRPQADYQRSLDVLKRAANHRIRVKSGLMLGMGETREEVEETLHDLREAGCTSLTIGQYLSPSSTHFPVARYVAPEEFTEWIHIGKSMAFESVVASPLVRSSYNAHLAYKG